MTKLLPSGKLARMQADKDFARTSDQFEDLVHKNGLMLNEVREIADLKIPQADKKEMLRLDAEMNRLSAIYSPL